MNPRHPFLCLGAISLLWLATGCTAPKVGLWYPPSPKPVVTAPIVDARTESQLIAMENEYIAAKNSQPTHQAYAEAEKKRKEQERTVVAQNQSAPEKDADPKP